MPYMQTLNSDCHCVESDSSPIESSWSTVSLGSELDMVACELEEGLLRPALRLFGECRKDAMC